jgi:hypothetical protein
VERNGPKKGQTFLSSYVGSWIVRKNRYFHGSTVVFRRKVELVKNGPSKSFLTGGKFELKIGNVGARSQSVPVLGSHDDLWCDLSL